MLNITNNKIKGSFDFESFKSFNKFKKHKASKVGRFITIGLIIAAIIMFLPWTQNINSKGYVTSVSPEHQPQYIQTIIGGQIDKWYVKEGDFAKKGDTIAHLSEVKNEYFDPNLLDITSEQMQAKSNSIDSYENKRNALKNQVKAIKSAMTLKLKQVKNKIKIDSLNLHVIKANLKIAQNQFERTKTLYDKGLKTLSEFQSKKLKLQSTINKVSVSQRKYSNQKNELETVRSQYKEKIFKAQSNLQSASASKYESIVATSKLKNKLSNYQIRSNQYYILAPQDGYISKILNKGIGEIIKQGSSIALIAPNNPDLAVEIYVKPYDVVLLELKNKVSLRFDGWPTLVVSGWPEASTGIFRGEVIGVDLAINKNGKYRVLIAPQENSREWPKDLRIGTGAQAFVLLKEVPIWYETWRQLNGFPLDYYKKNNSNYKIDKKSSSK